MNRWRQWLLPWAMLLVALTLAGCGEVPSSAPTSVPIAGPRTAAVTPGVAHVSLIVEPDDGVGPIARAIRDATKSVDLTMYLLTASYTSIVHALEYAHANGVAVRVLLEQHPYGGSNTKAYNTLAAADIPVRWTSSRFALTHEKGMVIDGMTAYIMSTNFTKSAFRSNREFDVVDRTPADVAAVTALFVHDWNDQPYRPTDRHLIVSPTNARAELSSFVTSAHSTLDVYAEELQDRGMEALLAAAATRGVRVRIIVPSASGGADSNAAGIAVVTRRGASVHHLAGLYVHAKAMVADGTRAFVGSENLSAASLDRNRELGVFVADRAAITRLEATFQADWTAS